MECLLEIKDASFSYDNKKNIWENLNAKIYKGDNISILGANGCGKTTLFNCISGELSLTKGKILLNNKNIKNYNIVELAKIIGIVYQEHTITFPYKSIDVVKMGRTPYLRFFETPSTKDEDIAYNVMKELGIEDLADKDYSKISGGQRQLVLIARTLCQDPEIILFDEPTSHLDFKNQFIVMKTIKTLSEKGITTIMTSHYPNHSFKTSKRVMLMGNKKIIADGNIEDVMTKDNLDLTYGVSIQVNKTADKQCYIDIDFSDI